MRTVNSLGADRLNRWRVGECAEGVAEILPAFARLGIREEVRLFSQIDH
jgi:hypothetical protein